MSELALDADQLKPAQRATEAIGLIVREGERFHTVGLDYRPGLRFSAPRTQFVSPGGLPWAVRRPGLELSLTDPDVLLGRVSAINIHCGE